MWRKPSDVGLLKAGEEGCAKSLSGRGKQTLIWRELQVMKLSRDGPVSTPSVVPDVNVFTIPNGPNATLMKVRSQTMDFPPIALAI